MRFRRKSQKPPGLCFFAPVTICSGLKRTLRVKALPQTDNVRLRSGAAGVPKGRSPFDKKEKIISLVSGQRPRTEGDTKMNLDLNFNALTKLKDWWQQVKNNFSIIQSECNETRAMAENACTKEQAQAYVAEFAGSSEEYMAAIEAFTALYNQSGASLGALEELVGARVPYTEAQGLDADSVTENGVYVCTSGTVNTPSESGVLISFSEALSEGFQLWFTSDGSGIYRRSTDGDWEKTDAELEDRVEALETAGTLKSEVVFGTYTGDGTASRTINLGFTPVAVEVCDEMGRQYQFSGVRGIFGGIAVTGHPCASGSSNKAIEIVENGFNVAYNSEENPAKTNQGSITYYFIAYKNGTVVEV